MSTARKILALLTLSERKSGLVLLGLTVIGMVFETFGLGLIIPAIALLMNKDVAATYLQARPLFEALGNPTQAQLVTWGLLVLLAIYVVKALFLAFLAWRQTRFAFDVQAQISKKLFNIYLRQPYTFHLHRNSAQLIRNISIDVNLFTLKCMLPSLMIITEGLVMVGVAGLLLAIEPLGALLILLVLGGSTWGFHLATSAHVARWGEARQHHEGLSIQHLQQGLGGAKEVKLFGREPYFLTQFSAHNSQTARMGEFQQTLQALPRLWLELLAVTALTILVVTMMIQGRPMDTVVQTVGLFAAAAFRLTPGVSRIMYSLQALVYGLPIVNTLYEECSLATPETTSENGSIRVFQNQIQLVNVSYAYPGSAAPVLDGVSVSIRKGECVGFIGHSGAGKTTLIDLILGLLQATVGQVLIDGHDIDEDLRGWQKQIGYVPQSIYLIDDTLRSNIAFGLPDEEIDEAALALAIRTAQLDEFVASLPDGSETLLGERGIRLSGGQRQRIAIARALYHNPAILVLDEATSSLDTVTERGVMEAVSVLRGIKTVIIVAHRVSTVEGCDRWYRLVEGKVLEEGGPDLVPSQPVPVTHRTG